MTSTTDLGPAVDALRDQLGEDRVLAGPEETEAARHVWNAAVDHRPAVIVRCASALDVQTVVRVARGVDAPLCVRGGGHDWAGRSVRDGAIVVDLSLMRDVEVRGHTVDVGGGATVSDVLDAAEPRGLAAVTGGFGSVGMAGLVLGGGYGPLAAPAGLAADNLLAAEVVTADGEIVRTDEHEHPDLLWCLRGAGGNFGVVTRMRLRLHAIPETTVARIAFPLASAYDVIPRCLAAIAEAPDELGVHFAFSHGPSGPLLALLLAWAGPAGRGERYVERLAALGDPLACDVTRTTVAALVRSVADQAPAGRGHHLSSRTLFHLPEPAIEALVRAAEALPTAASRLSVQHVRGVAARTPRPSAAFGQRGVHDLIDIVGTWEEGDGAAVREWVAATAKALEPWAAEGAWPNALGPDEDERARLSYGPNADRIATAKRFWDPAGMFTGIAIPHDRPGSDVIT